MNLLNNIYLKRIFNRIKLILKFPADVKFLFFNKNGVKKNGIVLVIHESNRLGASLLLLHTAKELIQQNKNVYIISLQFGELNKEYSKIAPLQIIFSKRKFKRVLRKLKQKYKYNKILMITVAVGDFVKTAYNLDYYVVSEVHELSSVVKKLGLMNAARSMLLYSNDVVFSTSSAKNELIDLTGVKDSDKFVVKPQGIYYKKPSPEKIDYEIKYLKKSYPSLLHNKVVIGVGNTSFRKGFDIFVDVAKRMPQYIFLWAGKKERFYSNIKKEKGLSDNFVYVGQLNDEQLAGVYSIASVLLLCSRVDTLPSTIFESLLFDVPVIGSKTSGGVTEIIKNKKNGLLTNNTSVNLFVQAIKECLSDNTQKKMNQYIVNTSDDNSFSNYISFIIRLYS